MFVLVESVNAGTANDPLIVRPPPMVALLLIETMPPDGVIEIPPLNADRLFPEILKLPTLILVGRIVA